MSDEIEWEVERILQRGARNGQAIYLVQWKGFPKSEATWQPVKNLEHCRNCIQEFQNTFKQCFSGQKKGKKRGKNKKMSLQPIKNQGLSEKVRMKDIKNQENCQQAFKIQEDTNLPTSEKKTIQKQAQKNIPEIVNKQCEIETLEIFSPFFVAPQEQIKEVKEQSQAKVVKRKPKAKRIFSRLQDDHERLPSKKVKFQTNDIENESLIDKKEKELEQLQKEKEQMIPKKQEQKPQHRHKEQKIQVQVQEQVEIELNDQNSQGQKSLKGPSIEINNQKSDLQNRNTVQPNSFPINPENVYPQIIDFKMGRKVTLSEFFHQRQISSDSLLKSQTKFFLNSCFAQKTNTSNTNPPLIDLTNFPDLLDDYNCLKPIKQPEVNMIDFKALIRTKCGWLVVGKVREVNSIAEVSDLAGSAWENLLQKYK